MPRLRARGGAALVLHVGEPGAATGWQANGLTTRRGLRVSTDKVTVLRAGVQIGKRIVGPRQPVYLVAEAGVNHNGRMDLALRLADVAADSGVDAVKFQIFRADAIAAQSAHKPQYMLQNGTPDESQRDLLAALALQPKQLHEVKRYAESLGLEFLCSPFDLPSLDALVDMGVSAIKLASTELTNYPLLRRAGRTHLPLILSTGTCALDEVADALTQVPDSPVALLHCVSSYPTAPVDANLRAIRTLADTFGTPVGFSDHTQSLGVPCLAVAAGACLLEKHFTLDPALPGPDHRFSLPPADLAEWVRRVRRTERVLGNGRKEPLACEWDVRASARKSVVAARRISPGEVITRQMLCTKRPGTGVEARHIDRLIGCHTLVAIPADTVIQWHMVQSAQTGAA